MKAQSQIIQFVLFFLIGMSIFGVIGNFFKAHAMASRERIENASLKLLESFVKAAIISYVETSKTANQANFSFVLPNTTADYYHEFYLLSNPRELMIKPVPTGKALFSSIHNLNYTLLFNNGFASSVLPLKFSYIREKNKLLLGE